MDNLTDQEIETLKKCQSEDEWNEACDQIKADRGGQYPGDWFQIIVLGKIHPDPTITITQSQENNL